MTSQSASQDNLDEREIARFERLAREWWAQDGKFKALHALTPARMRIIREAVVDHFGATQDRFHPLSGRTAVDVGCGGGLASEPLARMGANVTAIDPGADNIEAARRHAESVGLSIDYRVARAEDLAAANETFDLVVSLEVIEHVPDPAAFVATCASLVAPGGLMVLSTLNRTRKAYALAIIGAEYILGWLERGTHDWNRFVTPDELADFMRANGLQPGRARGTVYAPLSDSWVVSDDVSINYILSAARPSA